jgi:ABC-type lipoprotein release transport system permease subunit
LTAAGIAIGLALAAFAEHWISRIVPAKGSAHLPAEALAGAVVAAACLIACAVPAWQAAREAPAVALRRN